MLNPSRCRLFSVVFRGNPEWTLPGTSHNSAVPPRGVQLPARLRRPAGRPVPRAPRGGRRVHGRRQGRLPGHRRPARLPVGAAGQATQGWPGGVHRAHPPPIWKLPGPQCHERCHDRKPSGSVISAHPSPADVVGVHGMVSRDGGSSGLVFCTHNTAPGSGPGGGGRLRGRGLLRRAAAPPRRPAAAEAVRGGHRRLGLRPRPRRPRPPIFFCPTSLVSSNHTNSTCQKHIWTFGRL